jgi:acyl-coenzyme A thioesterase PaaI-like protein
MAAPPSNRLSTLVHKIHTTVPAIFQKTALSLAFNSNIKYAGTTGIAIQEWTQQKTIVNLSNHFRIRNHLGSIHACAMATLAESTTGMLFGLHVPDTHVPLLKSMKIDYNKRAVGNFQAVATLSEDEIKSIQSSDKGALIVPCTITDSEGKEPIACEMEWAWTSKNRKKSNQ